MPFCRRRAGLLFELISEHPRSRFCRLRRSNLVAPIGTNFLSSVGQATDRARPIGYRCQAFGDGALGEGICLTPWFEGRIVAIYRLLQNSVFGPEEIARMASAYEQALKALRLADRTDPVTELVAKKVIDVARTGETDPARISTLAIKALGARSEN